MDDITCDSGKYFIVRELAFILDEVFDEIWESSALYLYFA